MQADAVGPASPRVHCPRGCRTDLSRFEWVTGEVGEVNYCRDCGAEMVEEVTADAS